MRLVTYEIPNDETLRRHWPRSGWGTLELRSRTPRLGLLIRDEVADLQWCTHARLAVGLNTDEASQEALRLARPTMLGFLRSGEEAMGAARQTLELVRNERNASGVVVFPLSEVRLLAPLPRPNTMRDFISFEQHITTSYQKFGSGQVPPAWFEMPVYYKGSPDTVIGPDQDIIWPRYTEKLDYELELGMVVGKRGKDISKDDAASYIAGYTIFNDVSARDIQSREMTVGLGPAKGKDFDTGNVLGPCLVTPDEFDPSTARMIARVNGEVWSDGVAGAMRHSFADMIAHVSMNETIYPGDVFGSGTVGGGCGLELDKWLQPGDVIELEVEGIGVLRNRVVRP